MEIAHEPMIDSLRHSERRLVCADSPARPMTQPSSRAGGESTHALSSIHIIQEIISAKIRVLFVLLFAVSAPTFFSSCAPTSSSTRIMDWNDSLAAGPLRVILTPSPTSAVEVVRIEFHQVNEMERLYARIVDTAGHIFRLPHNIHAQWTLMGSGDENQFGLQGYNEQPEIPQPQVNVVKQRGYVEGHYLHLSVRQPKEGSSYALRVSVTIVPDLILEKTVNIGLQLTNRR